MCREKEILNRSELIAKIETVARERMAAENINEDSVLVKSRLIYEFDRNDLVFDAVVEYWIVDINKYFQDAPFESEAIEPGRIYLTRTVEN